MTDWSKCWGLASAFIAMLFMPPARAEWALNMPFGVTPISHQVYGLHMLIFWICCAIAVVVYGAIVISIWRDRKSRGAKAATFHESLTAEIAWTVVPFIILVAMAVPAAKVLVAMEDTGDADLTVKVTGYQWRWQYEYVNEDLAYYSTLSTPRQQIANSQDKGEHYLLEVDNPLVLPVGKKVRFLHTSNDVIHAWWVPDLSVKKDSIPGFINENWAVINEPGIYRGQCAELCGKDHGYMPIVVVAMEEADYQQWLADAKSKALAQAVDAEREWSLTELMARGEQVYATQCGSCHQTDGSGMAGVFPPIAGSTIATGPLNEHATVVMNGSPGTAMTAFGAQLSDTDLAAVLTYQRNAFGNATGDVIQPQRISKLRTDS